MTCLRNNCGGQVRMLAILLMFSCAAARADDSLEAWIATALERNPELVAAKQKWEAAKQKAPQARALEDPMIGVDVQRSDTTRLDTFTDNEWMISQKLPWFGKRGARGSVAALEAEAEGFRYLESIRSLRAQVKTTYWDLWLAQKSVEVTAENKRLMEEFEEIARVRYETGQGVQADLLRAQVELAKMSNELITMQREAVVAQAAVSRLLNEPLTTPRRVDEAVTLPSSVLTFEEMQQQALKYSTALLASARMQQAKQAAVRTAKLESAPEFEFRVAARQFNGRSGIQEYDTGVFLSFPWLWHGKYTAMVRGAKADLEMASADFENNVNVLMLDIKDLSTKVDTSQRLVKLYETSVVPQARQLVESTRGLYQVGRASFLELVDAQRALKDAQLDYQRARAQFGKDSAKIEQFIAPWGERESATGLMTAEKR